MDKQQNKLVKRTVLDTQPVGVSYKLIEYGWGLQDIIDDLAKRPPNAGR